MIDNSVIVPFLSGPSTSFMASPFVIVISEVPSKKSLFQIPQSLSVGGVKPIHNEQQYPVVLVVSQYLITLSDLK